MICDQARKATVLMSRRRQVLAGSCPPRGAERWRDAGIHPPCITPWAALRSQHIFSPPQVEDSPPGCSQSTRRSSAVPHTLQCPTSPGSSWWLSLCHHAGSHWQVCRDQAQNTARRSFSSTAISCSLSHSSTARFKTPEETRLFPLCQQPHLVTGPGNTGSTCMESARKP